jgi:hypothetical protein
VCSEIVNSVETIISKTNSEEVERLGNNFRAKGFTSKIEASTQAFVSCPPALLVALVGSITPWIQHSDFRMQFATLFALMDLMVQ